MAAAHDTVTKQCTRTDALAFHFRHGGVTMEEVWNWMREMENELLSLAESHEHVSLLTEALRQTMMVLSDPYDRERSVQAVNDAHDLLRRLGRA